MVNTTHGTHTLQIAQNWNIYNFLLENVQLNLRAAPSTPTPHLTSHMAAPVGRICNRLVNEICK